MSRAVTRDQVVEQFEKWQSHWTARDSVGLGGMYAEDCRVSSPIFGNMKGRTAVVEAHRRFFEVFPDWEVKTNDLFVDGERIVQVFTGTGTHRGEFMGLPGTGRKGQMNGVRIMKLADGLIVEELRLYDFTLFLMQIGVLRGKPAH